MIGVAQNPRVQNDRIQNQVGNGNLVAVRAEGNAAGHNGNQIRLTALPSMIQTDQLRLSRFVCGTVCFENDHVAAILGFGQFCNSDIEVAFRRKACFVRNLEGVDLLKGDCSTNLYTINLHEMASASPICPMAQASFTKSWLWHQRLSHLNFDTINDLAKNAKFLFL
nr:hypothetical protein [Tanacetum cinerariifolium]